MQFKTLFKTKTEIFVNFQNEQQKCEYIYTIHTMYRLTHLPQFHQVCLFCVIAMFAINCHIYKAKLHVENRLKIEVSHRRIVVWNSKLKYDRNS